MANNYKQEDIDYSRCWNDPKEACTVNEYGVAIPKWDEKHKLYKLWHTKRHTNLLKNANIWKDFAKEDIAAFKCIMFLMDYVDTGNMIMKRTPFDKEPTPITSENELVEILNIGKTTWKRVKKILFNKITPALGKYSIGINDTNYTFYFMNPLIAVDYRGISIPCYLIFKEAIAGFIKAGSSDEYSLNKHSKEYVGGDIEWLALNKKHIKRLDDKRSKN